MAGSPGDGQRYGNTAPAPTGAYPPLCSPIPLDPDGRRRIGRVANRSSFSLRTMSRLGDILSIMPQGTVTAEGSDHTFTEIPPHFNVRSSSLAILLYCGCVRLREDRLTSSRRTRQRPPPRSWRRALLRFQSRSSARNDRTSVGDYFAGTTYATLRLLERPWATTLTAEAGRFQ